MGTIERTMVAALAVVMASGCAAAADDATSFDSAVVDPEHSNIRSPELGTIRELKVLPNTNVPRAVLVALPEFEFVANLYDDIVAVNEAEQLTGTDGYQQNINLIVAASSRDAYDRLLQGIRTRHGLGASDPVPLIDYVEGVTSSDPWVQDFGEIAAVKGDKDPTRAWYGILDAGRSLGIKVDHLSSTLGLPVTQLTSDGSAGTFGGNTEATAEGTLYVGDAMPGPFMNGLRALGNQNLIVLPSSWLFVGHVDEYVNVLPAKNRCNSALLVASPLDALNRLRKAPERFTDLTLAEPFDAIFSALDAYAVHRRPSTEDYVLSDFDLTRDTESAYVKINLVAEAKAEEAIARLRGGACVEQVIRVPQFFRIEYRTKAIADNPGVANSLVLRSHAIVPDPKSEELRRVVRQRYAEALGSEDHVHFLDDAYYHRNDGEVHCGTNVVREIAMPYRM